MPHHETSPKQLTANRANAARSTGPRTPEGKARSAQNARKHGFTASNFAVVRAEDLEAVANLKEDLASAYQPVDAQELFAVERIALAQHALVRAARLEAGLFTCAVNQSLDDEGNFLKPISNGLLEGTEMTDGQNLNHAIADGFRRMARESDVWKLFFRYQAQTERRGALWARRAIEEFERLKGARAKLPNEPILEAEPESPQPLKPVPDKPIIPQNNFVPRDPDPSPRRPNPLPDRPTAPHPVHPASYALIQSSIPPLHKPLSLRVGPLDPSPQSARSTLKTRHAKVSGPGRRALAGCLGRLGGRLEVSQAARLCQRLRRSR